MTEVTNAAQASAGEQTEHDERPLPTVDDPDVRMSVPPEVRRAARRRFLQMAGAVGVGVGLAFTDALSSRFARRASAAAYEMWGDCRGYFDSSTTCYPPTAFYGDNCDGDWHRQARWVFPPFICCGPSTIADFTHLPSTCRGRNAWLWRWADGTATKCSDGEITMYYSTGTIIWHTFSICRTTGYY